MTARTIRPLNAASRPYCLNSMPGMSNCVLMTKRSPAIFFQFDRPSLLRGPDFGIGRQSQELMRLTAHPRRPETHLRARSDTQLSFCWQKRVGQSKEIGTFSPGTRIQKDG